MSRRILICAVGVGLLAVACSEVYACSSPPPPPPADPIARINGSAGSVTIYACKDSTVVFDGSASSDPDGGSITNYKWEFPAGADEIAAHGCSCDGCGSKCLQGPTCKEVECIFTSTGNHVVKLTVTDDDDPAGTGTCLATVKVVALNLTAYKRNGVAVSDADEDDPGPGAYVADNSWDDDDVNGIEDKDTDIVRKGGVTKENDMIKVHFGGFDGFAGLTVGKVVIRYSGCIKLWRYDYKGEEIEGTCVAPCIGWYEKVYDLSVPAQKVEFEAKIKDKDLWLEGRCPALGTKLILKYTTASDELVCSDEIKVNVISAWLEVYKRDGSTKVAIDEELDPGAYVAYNNDDDDANGILDKDTDLVRKDAVPKEDDTIKALFSLQHQFQYLDKGKVVLKRENAKIRLWKEEYKKDEIVFNSAGGTEKVYDFSVPAQRQECLDDLYGEEKWRWIEGGEASGSLKDTGLTLIYKDAADVDVLVEPVKLTVVEVDLDMDGVAEDEEESKGGFIALNDDDDDDNHTADKDESGPITDEDNLVKITLQKVLPIALTGNVTLKATAGGTKLKVWSGSTKGTEITLPKTYATPSDLPKDLYVEGYAASSSVRDITLALEYTVEGNTFADKVTLTVIDVQSIAVNESSDSKTHKIPSVLDASDIPDDHFVTAKGSGNIVLKATITPNTSEIRNAISWPGMTQDPSDKLKASQSRGTSDKFPRTVNVSGATAKSFTNWVVWSTTAVTCDGEVEVNVYMMFTKAFCPKYTFKHTITPQSILDTDADIPKLSGSNYPYPPPDVPASETGVFHAGYNLSGGANSKWDSSRQLRVKLLNPGSIDFSDPFYEEPTGWNMMTNYLNWPSNNVAGNDDDLMICEDSNPYLSPDEGKVTDYDTPMLSIRHSDGEPGDTVENKMHFLQFCRVLLGDTWYKISDDSENDWRFDIKFEKKSEADDNMDYNNDGDKLDEVWVNNNTETDTNHDGWD